MVYWILAAFFALSTVGSIFCAASGKTVDLIIAAILGVSATVALAGITIVHAIDRLPRAPKPHVPTPALTPQDVGASPTVPAGNDNNGLWLTVLAGVGFVLFLIYMVEHR